MDEPKPAHQSLAKNFKSAYYKNNQAPRPVIEFSSGLLSDHTLKITVNTKVEQKTIIAKILLPVSTEYSAALTHHDFVTTSIHVKNSDQHPHQIERFLIDHGVNAAEFYKEAKLEMPEKKSEESKEIDGLAAMLKKTYGLQYLPSIKLMNKNFLRIVFAKKEDECFLKAVLPALAKEFGAVISRNGKIIRIKNNAENLHKIQRFIEKYCKNASKLYQELGCTLPEEQTPNEIKVEKKAPPLTREGNILLIEKIKEKYNLSHLPSVTLIGYSPLIIRFDKNETNHGGIMTIVDTWYPSKGEGAMTVTQNETTIKKTINIANDDKNPCRIQKFVEDLGITMEELFQNSLVTTDDQAAIPQQNFQNDASPTKSKCILLAEAIKKNHNLSSLPEIKLLAFGSSLRITLTIENATIFEKNYPTLAFADGNEGTKHFFVKNIEDINQISSFIKSYECDPEKLLRENKYRYFMTIASSEKILGNRYAAQKAKEQKTANPLGWNISKTYPLLETPLTTLINENLLTIEFYEKNIPELEKFLIRNPAASYVCNLILHLECNPNKSNDKILEYLKDKNPPIIIKQDKGQQAPLYFIYGEKDGKLQLTKLPFIAALNNLNFDTSYKETSFSTMFAKDQETAFTSQAEKIEKMKLCKEILIRHTPEKFIIHVKDRAKIEEFLNTFSIDPEDFYQKAGFNLNPIEENPEEKCCLM